MTGKRTTVRIPWFTLLMAGLLVAVAITSGTLAEPLARSWRRAAGFGPIHLPQLEFSRLFTSAFLTSGGWRFYGSLSMLILCVGFCEWAYGAWRAAGCFWLTHVSTLMTESVFFITIFHWFEHPLTEAIVLAHDVGPSAGYYGCLGLALPALVPRRFRFAATATMVILLSLRLGTTLAVAANSPRAVSSDVAHLIAFGFGFGLQRVKPFAADGRNLTS